MAKTSRRGRRSLQCKIQFLHGLFQSSNGSAIRNTEKIFGNIDRTIISFAIGKITRSICGISMKIQFVGNMTNCILIHKKEKRTDFFLAFSEKTGAPFSAPVFYPIASSMVRTVSPTVSVPIGFSFVIKYELSLTPCGVPPTVISSKERKSSGKRLTEIFRML